MGSGGARLSRFLPKTPNTFFLVQAVAREYLLVGDTGSFDGYGGDLTESGDALWYDGRVDWRRSLATKRNGLLDLFGVVGLRMYFCASSGADGVPCSSFGVW